MNERKKRILCFGDSNTYGYDPGSFFGGSYPGDIIWTRQLEKAGFEVKNMGQNGLQTPTYERNMKYILDVFLQYFPFDLLTVMLGTNDLLQDRIFKAENVAERIEKFLSYICGNLPDHPKHRLLLIAPVPMKRGEWVYEERLIEESERLADCYKPVAGKLGIDFADASLWNVETTYDGVHFTGKGHTNFSKGLIQKIRDMGFGVRDMG